MSQIMKPRDVFALIVRIAGLVSLLYILGSSFLLAGFGLPFHVEGGGLAGRVDLAFARRTAAGAVCVS
jgi:hypothetical protein